MSILVVSSKYHPEYAGSGLRAQNTYARLKYPFDVVTSSINFQGNAKYQVDGADVYRISGPLKVPSEKGLKRKVFTLFNGAFELFFCLIFFAKNHRKYSLLHTFGDSWAVLFFSFFFSMTGKPIVRELCNDVSTPFYPPRLEGVVRSFFKKKNTLVVAISERLGQVCRRYSFLQFWVRPNPLPEKFHPDLKNEKDRFRSELSRFKAEDVVVGCFGNFIPRKNQKFLLDVLENLPKEYKLFMSGPVTPGGEEYFDSIRKEITERKFEDRVEISRGFIQQMEQYYCLSDVFVFPSLAEGLGTPILESQACQTPVVANHIAGITDVYIQPGIGGYCVELDARQFAQRVIQATEISKDTLLENARQVVEYAGAHVIDTEYEKRLDQIMKREAL